MATLANLLSLACRTLAGRYDFQIIWQCLISKKDYDIIASYESEQVVYILDQVRALEEEMLLRIKHQGLNVKPQILVVSNFIIC